MQLVSDRELPRSKFFLLPILTYLGRKNEDEQTSLHLACINGRIDVVKEILRADRNEIMNEDEDSNTPLHLGMNIWADFDLTVNL